MAGNEDVDGSSYVTCVECGDTVPENAQFCPSCGSPPLEPDAPLLCGQCGHTVEPRYEFCVSCGTSLSSDSSDAAVEQGGSPGQTQEQQPERPQSTDDADVDEQELKLFRRRLDPYLEHGWEISRDDGDSVELSYRDYGSAGIHVALVLFLVTIVWGNVLYAVYSAVFRKNSATLNAGSRRTWPDHDPTRTDGAFHWVLGVVMGLFTLLMTYLLLNDPTSLLAWLWTSAGILATGTLLPPINRRIQQRGSITEFGWQTRTDERIVHDGVQCTTCSSFVDDAIERSYEKYLAVAGARVTTDDSGQNYYCEGCVTTTLSTSVDRELAELIDDDAEDENADRERA